jgi:hypothetical protein
MEKAARGLGLPSLREFERDRSGRYDFRVPARWKAPIARHPFAAEAADEVLRWFDSLGCTEPELARARRFDVAGYCGMSFPTIPREKLGRIAKYLSLWLLWDDVHIETLENRWRIRGADVVAGRRPPDMTRFDEGWWQLMEEFAEARSATWIEALCDAMAAWNAAAVEEALMVRRRREGVFAPLERQLDVRIATIGMYATVGLLEDARDVELPATFHEDPRVGRIQTLANLIVAVGNDILSLGKDRAEDAMNLVDTTMHELRLNGEQALRYLLDLHERALLEYDRLADSLDPSASPEARCWLQDVRYASVGFSLWEAQAPRYTAHKIVVDGLVVEPAFVFEG